jgi:PilZ domain
MLSSHSFTRETTPVGEDRRAAERFPIERHVSYKTRRTKTGSGISVDISSSGVLIITEDPPNWGEFVEVAMDWPVQLDHKVRLKLAITGRVVRIEGRRVAICIAQSEFRTVGSHDVLAKGAHR